MKRVVKWVVRCCDKVTGSERAFQADFAIQACDLFILVVLPVSTSIVPSNSSRRVGFPQTVSLQRFAFAYASQLQLTDAKMSQVLVIG